MKHILIKSIAAAALTLGLTTGCSDELNISSIDPQSTATSNEQGLLGKCMACSVCQARKVLTTMAT